MNIVEFKPQASRIEELRSSISSAVSAAICSMDSAALQSMMRAPLQDFQKVELLKAA